MRRRWHPTPVLLPGKSHGRRSLVGCSPWGHGGSGTTEGLHFHFSLSCIGEGNGNPLQCSCLENPRDRGARCAAVYGVTQSQTRLKQLSSSSSRNTIQLWHWPMTVANQWHLWTVLKDECRAMEPSNRNGKADQSKKHHSEQEQRLAFHAKIWMLLGTGGY